MPELQGRHLITNSRSQCFKACPRKHFFKYVLGIRKEPSEALRMGSAVHEALDVYKTTGDEQAAVDAIFDNYQKLLERVTSDEYIDALMLERTKCAELTKGWIWRWGNDPAIEIIASEIPFDLPIVNPRTGYPNRNHRNAGKIDGICNVDGRLLLIEHKTCSESIEQGADYWDRLKLDEQITRYMLAARSMDYNVSGVFYDVIRKPSISLLSTIPLRDGDGLKIVLDGNGERALKKNGDPIQSANKEKGYVVQTRPETVLEYGDRLANDIRERPEFYFARVEIPRLEHELAEMRNEIWQVAQQIRDAEKHGYHFRNSSSCKAPYKCEFLEVCTSGTDLTEGSLPEGFERIENVNPELME